MLMEKEIRKYNVFIDMDGVVADFNKGICDYAGFPQSKMERGKYEIIDYIPDFDFTLLGQDWWADLEKLPDADEIVALMEKRFKFDNCYFLTSPIKNSYACHGGKQAWIDKHFPRYKRKILIGACKEACAGPNSILIDDSPKNCMGFQLNGGTAFMIPRYWNNTKVPEDNAVEKLKEFIDLI